MARLAILVPALLVHIPVLARKAGPALVVLLVTILPALPALLPAHNLAVLLPKTVHVHLNAELHTLGQLPPAVGSVVPTSRPGVPGRHLVAMPLEQEPAVKIAEPTIAQE